MNEATTKAWSETVRDHSDRLKLLLDLNAPDPIILNEIHMLHMQACGFFGEEYLNREMQKQTSAARRYSSLCQHCGNVLTLEQASTTEMCSECKRREDDEISRWEAMEETHSMQD